MDLSRVAAHDPVSVVDEEREAAVLVPIVEGEASETPRDVPRGTERPSDHVSGPRDGDAASKGRQSRPSAGEQAATEGGYDGDRSLLFIQRADDLSDHAGQMSFPGGGREPDDDDLLATALRESREEVGMDVEPVEVVGRLDDIRTVTRYSVRPFVARVPDQEWTPDPREVAEIVPLPLAELTDLDNYRSERRDHPHYGDVRLHYFHVGDYTVWGATGRILVQFLELTTDWEVPDEVDRVAEPDADFLT